MVGCTSDRWTRISRRKPFIAAGINLICMAVSLIGFAADVGYDADVCVVALISGPLDAALGGGNLPAFVLGSVSAALNGIFAHTILPSPSSSYVLRVHLSYNIKDVDLNALALYVKGHGLNLAVMARLHG
ncbi:proteinral substrate transporter [Ancistrocladus abbreviatus]